LGATIGVVVGVLGAGVLVVADGGPAGTIGVAGASLPLDEPEELMECDFATGACWPFGITIGADEESAPPWSPPLSPPFPPASESSPLGGQSIEVGGQLLPDEPPPPGGAQPEPAPKSPAPLQSAPAGGVGVVIHAETVQTATPTTTTHRRRTPLQESGAITD
jgi:hypothetical protein